MYLQILAAILPMPKAVQPFAAMMAPAAPRVCSAMLALKSAVRVEGGSASERGVVPIVAEDQAIWKLLVDGFYVRPCIYCLVQAGIIGF